MRNINNTYTKDKTPWGINPHPFLIKNIDYLKKGTALDLGCGDGKDSLFLARNGFKVTGVDISSEAINLLTEHAKKEDIIDNINPINQDIMEFIEDTKNKKEWDNIISFVTLHFWETPQALQLLEWV